MLFHRILDYFLLVWTALCMSGVCNGVKRREACDSVNVCDDGTTCDNGTCVCDLNTHYFLNFACSVKLALGTACPSGHTNADGSVCADVNAECGDSGSGIDCVCKDTHFNNGGTCTLKVGLGYQCPQPEACFTTNALCSGGSCRCSENYYDTNTEIYLSGTCELRKNLDASCDPAVNQKQCYESTATCRWSSISVLTTCQCDQGYYQDGQQCILIKALGDSCGDCSDMNAECFNSTCRCKAGYYDDNGSTFSGVCKPVAELRVTSIIFQEVKNTQLGVFWNAPRVAAFLVSAYVVEWRPMDNILSGSSQRVGSGLTGISISDLTAGKAYAITVTTVNSAAGYDRSASFTKFQATKPYPPPSLNVGNSTYNVQSNQILIVWNSPNGTVSGYTVQLFDGNTPVGEAHSTSTSTFITGTNADLKHGYNYTLKIVSKSETYGNGQSVESNTFSTFVKTVVTAPGAPTSIKCVSSDVESIILGWIAPTLPNGDLGQYIIKVRMYPTWAIVAEHLTGSTSTEFTVTGLTSGTSYRFDVYSQNEKFISSYPGSTQQSCPTKAQKAEMPRNVSVVLKTSRTVQVTWNSPAILYAEENLGYLVIVKPTETMSCTEEVLYECNNCVQSLNKPQTICSPSVSSVIMASAETLSDRSFNYTFEGLLPHTEYEVSIAAISNIGPGDTSVITLITNEEEPQKPRKPTIYYIEQTSFQVSWGLAEPRPGKVTYTVTVTADHKAPSKTFKTNGFTNTSLTVTGLEEYWGYVVQVTAATSVGSMTSDVSDKVTTDPAAPGVVDQFKVTRVPGGDYTKMRVSWRIPTVLQRNSIIKQFIFKHNTSSEKVVSKVVSRNQDDAYDYIEHLDIVPEQYYYFEVYAVNEQDEHGATVMQIVQAPLIEVPETPRDFIAIESTISESAATLTWTPGVNGGSPQTFTIQYKQSNANVWKQIVSLHGSTTSFTLDELRSDTVYIAKMTASNVVGDSRPTESIAFSTKKVQTLTVIVGGVLGGAALVVMVCVVVLVLFCKYRRSASAQDSGKPDRENPTVATMSAIDAEKSQNELMSTENSIQDSNGSGTDTTESSTNHYMGLSQYSNVQDTYAELGGKWS